MAGLLRLFLIALLLNIIWEFAHCWLYLTCRRKTWRQNVRLLTIMSAKDAGLIVLFYVTAAAVATGAAAMAVFLALALGFSFIDERVSVARGRWEYAPEMPRVFGVGATPLLELAVTGAAAVLIVL